MRNTNLLPESMGASLGNNMLIGNGLQIDLHTAASQGYIDRMRYLLANGVSVNGKDAKVLSLIILILSFNKDEDKTLFNLHLNCIYM